MMHEFAVDAVVEVFMDSHYMRVCMDPEFEPAIGFLFSNVNFC